MATATHYSPKLELGCRMIAGNDSDLEAVITMLEEPDGRDRAAAACDKLFATLTPEQRKCFYEIAEGARELHLPASKRVAWTRNILVIGGAHIQTVFCDLPLVKELFLTPPKDPNDYEEFLKLIYGLCAPAA